MKVTFLIPAHDEAATIGALLEAIARLDIDHEIIVVDDGSRDATASVVEARMSVDGRVRLLRKPQGGKGSALRYGIPYCGGDVVVFQDADLEYDPTDVPALLDPIERGAADVVYGSRLTGGRPQRAHLFWHLAGNRFLSLVCGMLFNTTLTDMETGYKVFRADVLRTLYLTRDDFGIEPEITGEICRRGLRVYEVPIAYYGRTYAEGKKITWRDGLRALQVLVVTRLRPLRPAPGEAVADNGARVASG